MRRILRSIFVIVTVFVAVIHPRLVSANVIGAPSGMNDRALAFYMLAFFAPNPPAPPPLPPYVYVPVDTRQTTAGKTTYSITYSYGPPPISISGYGDRDPYIDYTLSITNNSDLDEFVYFFFGIPIAERGDNSSLFTVMHLDLEHSGNGNPSITPSYDGFHASPGIQRALLSSDGGNTFDTEFGPLGGVITTSGLTDEYFFQAATILPPVTTYNYLGVLNGFVLSAGTSVTIDGFIGIDSVIPEPSTLLLSLTSFVALAAYGGRWRVRR